MTETSQHYCIVITRPDAQAAPWATQLQSLGFACSRLNLLEISAITDEEKLRAIKNKILAFDLYQKAIFVSQNAVDFGMDWLEAYWPQLPMGIAYFAVGATTAKKLADYGVAVQDLAASAKGGMTSEDLLGAEHLQQVDGEKILIFRGCGGRGHLAEELRKRGASVDYCEVYERGLPSGAQGQLLHMFESQKSGDARLIISVHSGESLQNLLAVVTQLSVIKGSAIENSAIEDLTVENSNKENLTREQLTIRTWIFNKLLLVPSQRLVAAAQAAGFRRVICAENATDNAMTAALLDFCRTQECILLQD